MNTARSENQIKEFYGFASEQGVSEYLFFRAGNYERYIETAVDGYNGYPLFLHVFGGKYDEKTLERMMSVDFMSRLDTMAGIASSDHESVMMIEPPGTQKTGMMQYVRVADFGAYTLLFKPAMYRLEDFEKYALEKRKKFLDEKTWYIYLFATKKEFQGCGYGNKLMNTVLSFADDKGCNICLETNSEGNIAMYEHFGFVSEDMSEYKDMKHCVMVYRGN